VARLVGGKDGDVWEVGRRGPPGDRAVTEERDKQAGRRSSPERKSGGLLSACSTAKGGRKRKVRKGEKFYLAKPYAHRALTGDTKEENIRKEVFSG